MRPPVHPHPHPHPRPRPQDELQRVALTDPATRLHDQFEALGPAHRTQMLTALLQLHGAGHLAAMGQPERLTMLQGLVSSLPLEERQQLLRSLVLSGSVTGSTIPFLDYVSQKLDQEDMAVLLKQHALRCKRQLPARSASELGKSITHIFNPPPKLVAASTQAPPRRTRAERERELSQLAEKLGEQSLAALQPAREYPPAAVEPSSWLATWTRPIWTPRGLRKGVGSSSRARRRVTWTARRRMLPSRASSTRL